MRLGYHMPTAGGYKKQVPFAQEIGAETIQVFLGGPTTWKLSPFDAESLSKSGAIAAAAGIAPLIVHCAYLINMASKNEENYQKSRELLQESLKRAAALSAPYVVVHIGSHGGEGLDFGLQRIAEMFSELRRDWPEGVSLLLENTAGGGHTIGSDMAEIGRILLQAGEPDWLGVCFDTCHAWAAGYRLRNETEWKETLSIFDGEIGLKALKALHINDSMMEFASKRDRHAHIGEGQIGVEGFRAMLLQPELSNLPGVLETPDEGDNEGYRRDLDLLKKLRAEVHG